MASITITSRRPVAGSAVNTTPGGARVDHLLDDQMHRDRAMSASWLIGRGSFGMDGDSALADSRGETLDRVDTQHSVVLSGEGLLVAVLSGGRGPDGHR